VTKNRQTYFGKIEEQQSILSSIGKYMDDNIRTLSEKISEIKVTEYVIMPDHIHLILSIENNASKEYENYRGNQTADQRINFSIYKSFKRKYKAVVQ
jgi:REP element-mobilizing transposase RayT